MASTRPQQAEDQRAAALDLWIGRIALFISGAAFILAVDLLLT